MITAQIERLDDCLEEIKIILPMEHQEMEPNHKELELNPMWELYRNMEDNGSLVIATLRDNGVLVGYFVSFLVYDYHYSCLSCKEDVIYLLPEYRCNGGGVKLFHCVEAEIKKAGVKHWTVASKAHADVGAFFEKMGFSKSDIIYERLI